MHPVDRFSSWLPHLLLALATLVVYYPVLSHEFLEGWDDQWMVMNPYTFDWGFDNIGAILTQFHHGQYSPLNQLCYTLLFRLFGANPVVFHAFPLLLHLGCTLWVFVLIRKLLAQGGTPLQTALPVAFLSALLFAIHPLQVEAVAWISASKIPLFAFCYLCGLGAYLRYLQNRQLTSWILVCLCFALSFGAKEQAVTFPFALLLMDWIARRDFTKAELWLEKLPLLILMLNFAYITLLSHASTNQGLLSHEGFYPLSQRIAFSAYALTEYLSKILAPVNLLYIYPFPNEMGEPMPLQFWSYPILWVIILLLMAGYIRKVPQRFAILFFFLQLGLVLHIIPMSRINIVADRYIYLPLIGITFLMAWSFVQLLQTQSRHTPHPQTQNQQSRLLKTQFAKGGLMVALLYLLYLGGYANSRCRVWQNDTTLKKELKELATPTDTLLKPLTSSTAAMKIVQEICMQNQHAAQDPPFRLQFWRRHNRMDVVRLERQYAIFRQK